MFDRDDLAFFARAMTPSKATTDAGWDRLRASIEAEEVEPVVVRRRAPRTAMWIGASMLAAAAVGVFAFAIDRERWTAADEEIDRSQAVDAREEAEAPHVEVRPRGEASPPRSTRMPAAVVPAAEATAVTSSDEPVETTRAPRDDRSAKRSRPRAAPRAPTPASAVAPPVVAPPEPQRPTEDPIALEAASLRRVERAIAASDLARARALLRAHRERFADGILAREASLLQVVIACEAADSEAAASAANQHASAFPNDPTTARLRRQVCSKR